MLSQDPGSETQFLFMIFLIAVSVFGLMLIGVLIAALPQIRSRDKQPQISSTGLPAPSPEETATHEESVSAVQSAPEIASTPLSPFSGHLDSPREHEQELMEEAPFAVLAPTDTELTPFSSLGDHIESASEQGRKIPHGSTLPIRQILGVALTIALIVVPVLVMMRFLLLLIFYLAPIFLPISAALVSIWAALACAIGLRMAKLSWRQTVLAALLAGAAFPVIAGAMLRGRIDSFTLLISLGGMIWVSGGVFLLPLFDLAVRQMGPAPSNRKVAKIALVPALLFIALVIISVLRAGAHPASGLVAASDQFGWVFFTVYLLELRLVLLPASILLGVGLIITLAAPRNVAEPDLKGSWLGGVGLLFLYFTLAGLLVVAAVATMFRV